MALRGRSLVLAGGGAVLAVASPLAFALGSAETGDAVSASIIAATAVAALAVPLWSSRTEDSEPGEASGDSVARDTGLARAEGGGDANTGVRHRHRPGPARAERTGPAIAHGPGSRANSGLEEAD